MLTKSKRHLFDELKEGIEEINAYKSGKITLRTHSFKRKAKPHISASLIRETRESFHMSRNVFALKLRVSPRTLEKWEHGSTIPNDQASALILMLRKYPDTLKRLEEV